MWLERVDFSYFPSWDLKAALMSIGVDYLVYEKARIVGKNSGDYDYNVVDTQKSTSLMNIKQTYWIISKIKVSF